jgi:hypothetical protein
MTKKQTKKQAATALLREYDRLYARMRVLERETQKAVTAYGVESGVWGLSIDKFRLQLRMEAERREKERADG